MASSRKLRLNPAMVNDAKRDAAVDDLVRAIAVQRGLARALEQFPETVHGAGEKGVRPLAAVPSGPLTEPAAAFDPALVSSER